MTSSSLPRTLGLTIPSQPRSGRIGLFRRIIDALADANRRKAEREIAAYLRRNGGKLTDRIEREVERGLF